MPLLRCWCLLRQEILRKWISFPFQQVMLLQNNDLLNHRYQQTIAIFLLWEMYKSESIGENPFAYVFFLALVSTDHPLLFELDYNSVFHQFSRRWNLLRYWRMENEQNLDSLSIMIIFSMLLSLNANLFWNLSIYHFEKFQ